MRSGKLVIVNSHPIQYFAPLYRELARLSKWDFTVVYCSKKGLQESLDAQFGRRFKWDVDLLGGYQCQFISEAERNTDLHIPQIRCKSLPALLDSLSPSAILIHGYYGPAARTPFAWARKRGCPVLMRGDTWTGAGEGPGLLRRRLKRIWFRHYMLPHIALFLAVGILNAEYWRELGASPDRIATVPYGVDKDLFSPGGDRDETLDRLGLNPRVKTIGFFGRLHKNKGLMQLLEYRLAHGSAAPAVQWIIVGDGPLRPELEALLPRLGSSCRDLGFRNQSELPALYRSCDLVIDPSLWDQTWGFVVQEALACGAPVAVSKRVGCAPDLIREGVNGCVLPAGDWKAWSDFIDRWASGQLELRCESVLGCPVPGFEDSAQAMIKAIEDLA